MPTTSKSRGEGVLGKIAINLAVLAVAVGPLATQSGLTGAVGKRSGDAEPAAGGVGRLRLRSHHEYRDGVRPCVTMMPPSPREEAHEVSELRSRDHSGQ